MIALRSVSHCKARPFPMLSGACHIAISLSVCPHLVPVSLLCPRLVLCPFLRSTASSLSLSFLCAHAYLCTRLVLIPYCILTPVLVSLCLSTACITLLTQYNVSRVRRIESRVRPIQGRSSVRPIQHASTNQCNFLTAWCPSGGWALESFKHAPRDPKDLFSMGFGKLKRALSATHARQGLASFQHAPLCSPFSVTSCSVRLCNDLLSKEMGL